MLLTVMDRAILKREQAVLCSLLKEVRLRANTRQQEIAARLGEPQSFVSKYESGERRLDVLELRYVCSALGISLAALIEELERRLAASS